MFFTKSTTADEVLIFPKSNGINLRSLIVTATVANTVILKDGIGGAVLYKQPVVADDSRGFITNFPVVKSSAGIVIALASANQVEIYYDY